MIKDYKDLLVWQKSIDMVKEVYNLLKLLPREERYALGDQLRRAAVSVPSNIAEGYCRVTDKELLSFLSIARGSCAELETQLIIAREIGYFSLEDAEKAVALCFETRKMLNAFISKLKS